MLVCGIVGNPKSRLFRQSFEATLLKRTDSEFLFSFAVAASTSAGAGMSLSHSASSLSLQQAFSELRHAQMAEGPSTAPANFRPTGPAFPAVPPSVIDLCCPLGETKPCLASSETKRSTESKTGRATCNVCLLGHLHL